MAWLALLWRGKQGWSLTRAFLSVVRGVKMTAANDGCRGKKARAHLRYMLLTQFNFEAQECMFIFTSAYSSNFFDEKYYFYLFLEYSQFLICIFFNLSLFSYHNLYTVLKNGISSLHLNHGKLQQKTTDLATCGLVRWARALSRMAAPMFVNN